MTPSVPWVRKTGWTDPIYIALEGGEQMQKYLFLSSPVLCPTVPWLDHKGLADGTWGFGFFVFSLFDLVPPFFWGRIFPFSVWSAVCLLFPCLCFCSSPEVMESRSHRTYCHGPVADLVWERWCCWAWRRGGLSQRHISLLFVFSSPTPHTILCKDATSRNGLDQHSHQLLKVPLMSSGSVL